jgi:hypothetical protein
MVTGSSQRNALNQTALGAANALTNWSNLLVTEMEKQGVTRYPKPTSEGDTERERFFATDDNQTMTFERGQIRRLLDGMDALKGELLRFEKPTVPRDGK